LSAVIKNYTEMFMAVQYFADNLMISTYKPKS